MLSSGMRVDAWGLLQVKHFIPLDRDGQTPRGIKSRDGRIGREKEDRTVLDEKRRVTIGYITDNNQRVEIKVPVDGFEIDELTSSRS
ncbi:MAG TPA: hypothetical protein VE971_03565 [Candidatus Eisenbacteria bacterium]|nr:hypothetical protein [Candidatus Eisenbacteria bacterium]